MPAVYATLATATVAFLTALLGYLATLRAQKKIQSTSDNVSQVRVLVDGHLSTVEARVDQLLDTLKGANVEIPAAPTPVIPPITPEGHSDAV